MKNDLNDIVRRVEKLEVVFDSLTTKRATKSAKRATNSDNLQDKILALRDAGFFKQPKVAPEVHTKLQSTYSCNLNRVEVALYRMGKKKTLRIASKIVDGKKKKAYTW